jgi:GDPmannose 4,6-dehydratase
LQKKAIILGISGQDGLYLSSRLVRAGYRVVGVSRNTKERNVRELPVLDKHENVNLRHLDAQDSLKLNALFDEWKPVEIYNLAGESSVAESFKNPMYAVNSNIKITLNCLEYIRTRSPDIKFFNASSSECFGNQGGVPASETTPFCPISPYAVGKACAYSLTKTYREVYGMFACSAIMFNHESRFRGSQFVSQKIVSGARLISEKRISQLELGNLNIERDWGWAPEYVDGIFRIMQHGIADDFVLATGESNKLSTFVDAAFRYYGLNWENWVISTDQYFRPADIEKNCGNPSKARRELGWVAKYRISDIVKDMAGDLAEPVIQYPYDRS